MSNQKIIGFTHQKIKMISSLLLSTASVSALAQDGNAGINSANTLVRGYFDTGITLLYAIGAVVGLVGAVKVFNKWNSGDQDTSKVAAARSEEHTSELQSLRHLVC